MPVRHLSPTSRRPGAALLAVSALLCLAAVAGCKTREIGDATISSKPAVRQYRKVLVFSDDFNRPTLGANWKRGVGEHGSGKWRIEDGWVAGDSIKNDPLWLQKPLPKKVRVEFDAKSLTAIGDLKFEIFGDGKNHESGYIVIFGGWKNSLDVIARLDEHGKDRLAKSSRRVRQNHAHKIAVERTGETLRWYVDGVLALSYHDPKALRGPEHRFFAFNDWMAPVRFDNLKVYELR